MKYLLPVLFLIGAFNTTTLGQQNPAKAPQGPLTLEMDPGLSYYMQAMVDSLYIKANNIAEEHNLEGGEREVFNIGVILYTRKITQRKRKHHPSVKRYAFDLSKVPPSSSAFEDFIEFAKPFALKTARRHMSSSQ